MSGLKATPMTCYGSKLTKQSKYSVLPCSGPKIRSLHLIESSALILTFASTPYSQAFLSRARTWIELSVVQMFLIIAHCLSSLVCVTTPAHPPVRPFLFVILWLSCRHDETDPNICHCDVSSLHRWPGTALHNVQSYTAVLHSYVQFGECYS